nr:hypothetical protein CFP56_59216 [Quercus suber]
MPRIRAGSEFSLGGKCNEVSPTTREIGQKGIGEEPKAEKERGKCEYNKCFGNNAVVLEGLLGPVDSSFVH